MTQAVVFISHTTKDKRDFALAHTLAQGLTERGAKVWIAPESIPAGNEWSEDIVLGVIQRSTHFLVILSAASVRAPWVAEEIRLAQKRRRTDKKFRVLPLVVGALGRHRHQAFVRSLQEVPYHEEVQEQLEAVAEAIGLRPVVPDRVRAVILEKTRDFTGRAYIFARIAKFLREGENGYLTIEGDPGIGKSAILATLVQRTGAVAHFNIRAQGVSSTHQFLETVCAQIIARFGLPYSRIPPDALRSGAFLGKLLDEAAAKLGKDERLMIAVDALDEVDDIPKSGNLLFLPQTLPRGVYFVLTRRRVALPLVFETRQDVIDLMKYKSDGLRDAKQYLQIQFKRQPALRAWIKAGRLSEAVAVKRLSELSEGNFMYLRYVTADIASGRYKGLAIKQLPRGLIAYYEDHWRRMGMIERPVPRAKIQIIYVLGEATLPVSRRLLTRLASNRATPIDEVQVQEVLDDWEPFIREQQQRGTKVYSIYHASFQDFLRRQDIVEAAGRTLPKVHGQISSKLWTDLFGSSR